MVLIIAPKPVVEGGGFGNTCLSTKYKSERGWEAAGAPFHPRQRFILTENAHLIYPDIVSLLQLFKVCYFS